MKKKKMNRGGDPMKMNRGGGAKKKRGMARGCGAATKVKQKPIRNIKIKNQKRKTIRAKQGGSIGNKLVASIYGGCN